VGAVPAAQQLKSNGMHVHILGICGTFMGGVAAIARAAGFTVTGSDRNVPADEHQLEALGITLTEGFEAAQLSGPRHGDRRQCHDARSAGDQALARAGCPTCQALVAVARVLGRWGPAVGTHLKPTARCGVDPRACRAQAGF
jgi:UDP-N-acetylmuramate-alanine ligase